MSVRASNWRKSFDPETWNGHLDVSEWSKMANNPTTRLEAAMWGMRIGQKKQDLFFDLVEKLRATMKHAEEMLGKDIRLSLVESYTPVMFIINSFEEYLVSCPSGIRDIAIDEGARPVSRDMMRELDRFLEFASIAYDKLDTMVEVLSRKGFTLVYFDEKTEYEVAAHYLSFNVEEKICLIGIKGTSTMNDVLTDILCKTTPFIPGKYAHDGIKNAARRIVHRIHPFLESLFLPLGYRVVLTGHSLGAGVAACVAMILKEELGIDDVFCYAYATPPVVDRCAAIHARDYIISLVNDRDVVCRTSLSNMNIMHEVLVKVNDMLKEGKLSKDQIISLNEETHEEKLNAAGLLAMLRNIQDEFKLAYEQDLYIPGRVVYMFQSGSGRYDALQKDGTLTGLRQMLICKTMLSDHQVNNYRSVVREILFHNHNYHSVSTPGMIKGAPGTHISIEGWSSFTSPRGKKITFYEIAATILRDKSEENAQASELDANSDSMFGFVDHTRTTFTVWRRYNDFLALDADLKALGMAKRPSLPSKITGTSPRVRVPSLEGYIRTVVLYAVAIDSDDMMNKILAFLGGSDELPIPDWVLREVRANKTRSMVKKTSPPLTGMDETQNSRQAQRKVTTAEELTRSSESSIASNLESSTGNNLEQVDRTKEEPSNCVVT